MKTFRKYVEIARVMRVTNSTVLDIKDLTPLEAANVVELVKNDALFSFLMNLKIWISKFFMRQLSIWNAKKNTKK